MTATSQPDRAQRSTIVVTNLTKLAGIVIGVKAGLSHDPDYGVLALAAVFVMGVEVAEDLILRLLDRIFGVPPKES